MRTKEHADAHASNNKATSHTEALAISHLTRVKRSTTRRIQKRANARHCRLKFIEFRLAVKRGEGKRGFKGSRNTTRPSSPANSDPLLARFQETGRANRQITFEPAPSGTTTVWYTHDSMPNKSNPVLPSHGFDSFDSTFGIWIERCSSSGMKKNRRKKGARPDSESQSLPSSSRLLSTSVRIRTNGSESRRLSDKIWKEVSFPGFSQRSWFHGGERWVEAIWSCFCLNIYVSNIWFVER